MRLLCFLSPLASLLSGLQLNQPENFGPAHLPLVGLDDGQLDSEAVTDEGDGQLSDDHWVIFDALAESGLYGSLQAEATVHSPEVLPVGLHEASSRSGQRSWVFGSHHKSGTVLLRHLAKNQAGMMGVVGCYDLGTYGMEPKGCPFGKERMFFSPALTVKNLGLVSNSTHGNMRAVHIVRDPLAMVISGYIYHMRSFDTPRRLRVIRNMTLREGLEVEAQWHMRTTLPVMVKTFQMANPEETLHVKLESFTRSSQSFDRTVEAVYNFTIGDMTDKALRQTLQWQAMMWDLRRNPLGASAEHIAPGEAKRLVREAVSSLSPATNSSLEWFRKALGY